MISIASVHNYASGNTLVSFEKSLGDLITLSWFRNIKIIAYPNKFQAILLKKSNSILIII